MQTNRRLVPLESKFFPNIETARDNPINQAQRPARCHIPGLVLLEAAAGVEDQRVDADNGEGANVYTATRVLARTRPLAAIVDPRVGLRAEKERALWSAVDVKLDMVVAHQSTTIVGSQNMAGTAAASRIENFERGHSPAPDKTRPASHLGNLQLVYVAWGFHDR